MPDPERRLFQFTGPLARPKEIALRSTAGLTVVDLPDRAVHARFAQQLFDESGFDIRGQEFDHFYVADLTGASTVEVVDDHLDITIWKPGEGERVVQKR